MSAQSHTEDTNEPEEFIGARVDITLTVGALLYDDDTAEEAVHRELSEKLTERRAMALLEDATVTNIECPEIKQDSEAN